MNNTYENINLDKLEAIPVRRKRGIYFLYRGLDLVYIGQTTHLDQRLHNHTQDKTKEFDSYKFLEINGTIDLSVLEITLIKRFQPVYNKNSKVDTSRKERNKQQYYKNKHKIKIVNNFNILTNEEIQKTNTFYTFKKI